MVITILTKEGMTTEQVGFEVDAEIKPPAEVIEAREHEIPIDEPNQPGSPDEGMQERQEGEAEQEGRLVVGQQLPKSSIVNEVELRPTSRLRELKAACKCFQRLVSHVREAELKAASEAAAAARTQESREPRGQNLIPGAGPEEQERHCLTHTPYAPWCEACLVHRGRPDRHQRTSASTSATRRREWWTEIRRHWTVERWSVRR